MKAFMSSVPPDILAWRKRTGADQWDEMWDGVLHMTPSPNREHQDLEFAVENYLRTHWQPRSGGKVYHQINVARPGTWPNDYRIPDVILLLPERFSIDRNEYFEGGPDVAVEIRSPDDETYDKMPFYAGVGVREVWVIDRDTKICEIHALEGTSYRKLEPNSEGWLESPVTSVLMRSTDKAKVELRIGGAEETLATVP